MARTDSNGYIPSLFNTTDGTCYICGCDIGTERHEVFGASNRENSKHYGLWINVCPYCHRLSPSSIHLAPEKHIGLKAEAQELFEEEHPEKDFLEIFGRNYLENKRG